MSQSLRGFFGHKRTVRGRPPKNAGYMVKRLSNKVAIVTASTQGIGFEIARRLNAEGANVVICSRKEDNVNSAVKKLQADNPLGKILGMVCHVGMQEDRSNLINTTVKHFGKIDFLISNAATNPTFGSILDVTESAWDKLFDTNVKSAFFLTKEAVPHMNKDGSIVFVASIAGYNPIPFIGAYSVTKTSLLGLVKALSMELAPEGIRVNAIAPGIINTRFSKNLVEDPQLSQGAIQMTHLKRLGQPEDCAGTVAYLCSADSAYVTGETICITGGMPSRL